MLSASVLTALQYWRINSLPRYPVTKVFLNRHFVTGEIKPVLGARSYEEIMNFLNIEETEISAHKGQTL